MDSSKHHFGQVTPKLLISASFIVVVILAAFSYVSNQNTGVNADEFLAQLSCTDGGSCPPEPTDTGSTDVPTADPTEEPTSSPTASTSTNPGSTPTSTSTGGSGSSGGSSGQGGTSTQQSPGVSTSSTKPATGSGTTKTNTPTAKNTSGSSTSTGSNATSSTTAVIPAETVDPSTGKTVVNTNLRILNTAVQKQGLLTYDNQQKIYAELAPYVQSGALSPEAALRFLTAAAFVPHAPKCDEMNKPFCAGLYLVYALNNVYQLN